MKTRSGGLPLKWVDDTVRNGTRGRENRTPYFGQNYSCNSGLSNATRSIRLSTAEIWPETVSFQLTDNCISFFILCSLSKIRFQIWGVPILFPCPEYVRVFIDPISWCIIFTEKHLIKPEPWSYRWNCFVHFSTLFLILSALIKRYQLIRVLRIAFSTNTSHYPALTRNVRPHRS